MIFGIDRDEGGPVPTVPPPGWVRASRTVLSGVVRRPDDLRVLCELGFPQGPFRMAPPLAAEDCAVERSTLVHLGDGTVHAFPDEIALFPGDFRPVHADLSSLRHLLGLLHRRKLRVARECTGGDQRAPYAELAGFADGVRAEFDGADPAVFSEDSPWTYFFGDLEGGLYGAYYYRLEREWDRAVRRRGTGAFRTGTVPAGQASWAQLQDGWSSMSDSAARDRDAAETESALSHPPVAPDASAAYGSHPDQLIDFYAPRDGRTGAPVVVVLHGGAWRAPYDRQHVSPFADFLARRGFAVASVEYRRGSEIPQQRGAGPVAGRWPETFDDVAAAMDALPALLARELPQADARRIVVTGHSAGGQLALWAAARHVLPEGSPWRLPAAPQLRGVVALAPIADFATAVGLDVCSGAVGQFLGREEDFGERAPHADPAVLLPTGIATTVVQGTTDVDVPQAVAEAFVDAAAKAGETVGLTLLPDVGHYPLIDPAADACAVVAEELAQLAW